MTKIRKNLSYANVVASLALFLVVSGGAAYAAFQLPKNSVGNRQLRRNAITGVKVKNGSLLGADFGAGQLPAGPRGEQGPKGDSGPQGPPGLSGYIQENGFSAFNSNSPKSVLVACPPGTKVVGGGAFIFGADAGSVAVNGSGPQDGGEAWIAEAFEAIPTGQEWDVDARAVCARVDP